MRTQTGPPEGHDDDRSGGPDAPVVADRTCGRCRQPFAGDPSLNFQTDWTLCPACAEKLMPGRLPSPAPRT